MESEPDQDRLVRKSSWSNHGARNIGSPGPQRLSSMARRAQQKQRPSRSSSGLVPTSLSHSHSHSRAGSQSPIARSQTSPTQSHFVKAPHFVAPLDGVPRASSSSGCSRLARSHRRSSSNGDSISIQRNNTKLPHDKGSGSSLATLGTASRRLLESTASDDSGLGLGSKRRGVHHQLGTDPEKEARQARREELQSGSLPSMERVSHSKPVPMEICGADSVDGSPPHSRGTQPLRPPSPPSMRSKVVRFRIRIRGLKGMKLAIPGYDAVEDSPGRKACKSRRPKIRLRQMSDPVGAGIGGGTVTARSQHSHSNMGGTAKSSGPGAEDAFLGDVPRSILRAVTVHPPDADADAGLAELYVSEVHATAAEDARVRASVVAYDVLD